MKCKYYDNCVLKNNNSNTCTIGGGKYCGEFRNRESIPDITYKEILCNAIQYYGEDNQLQKTIEEASELIQAISRYNQRNKNDTMINQILISDIIEEIVDIQIMIDQIKIIMKSKENILNEYEKHKKYKLDRLNIRMNRSELHD